MKLDIIDQKLLQILQENSQKTNKELANELHLSVTAVYERIKKLEKNKFIKNYVAIVDKSKVEKDFMVLCHIKLAQHRKEYIQKFEQEISKFHEVLECFHVSGDYDYILKICVKNIHSYRDFMVSKLTNLEHIASTQSSFCIKEVKSSTVVFIN